MKISTKNILIALVGVYGIFAYAQENPSPQNPTTENSTSSQREIPTDSKARIEYFRQRREARRMAREEFENGGGSEFGRPRFSRRINHPDTEHKVDAPKPNDNQDLQEEVQIVGDSELLKNLVSKNPFSPVDVKASEQNQDGVSLKSIAMLDGKWVFSVSDKSGKTMWIGIGEELENSICKINSFDEKSMTVKATVSGRQMDLTLAERSTTGSSGKVELVDAIKPRRMIAPHERAKVWSQYATDEQREAANRVWQTARAQGRNYLNRDDRRKLFEIERTIQIPENANQGGGQPNMPPMPSR